MYMLHIYNISDIINHGYTIIKSILDNKNIMFMVKRNPVLKKKRTGKEKHCSEICIDIVFNLKSELKHFEV